MDDSRITQLLGQVSADRLRSDLFTLAGPPRRFRKANHTRPGSPKSSLEEADDYLVDSLAASGIGSRTPRYRVQAFRCDGTKPLHHWYATPDPADPFYEVANIEAELPGTDGAGEIVQLVSHKDSMSWIDSPGAHDNAAGTAVNLEIARILSTVPLRRTVRFLFCNEEHTPWTSRFAAEEAKARGDRIVAVLNNDSLAGKSDEDRALGRMLHVVAWSTEEGRALARFVESANERFGLGLEVMVVHKERVNDDDGMYINAGFPATAMNVGSWPYGDEQYHLEGDVPERVDIDNLARSTRLILAAVLLLTS
jgi:hypothetical protein